ncbi:hypothetical protein KGQ19_15540 [Catenulispora sp. NL8]|uniref:Integral membrane protein n=1 Tax=Catenulispora pinistramenti TaxID=2705254 RepID=A0ABS5KQF1_9ACTN|nr:hypothetical protein [Catenulispora pinistramenti]MBS2548277.1 hypothetical protein [Catenulispora pinistramenti]
MSDIAVKRPDPGSAELPEGAAVDNEVPTLVYRAITLLGAAGVFWAVFQIFPFQSSAPYTGIYVALGCIAALGVAITAMAAKDVRTLNRANHILVATAALGIICYAVGIILSGISYGTDEEIFVQHSAHLLGQGVNPYGADLTPAFHRYAMSSQFYTKLLDGTYTHGLDYPAVPVLLTWAANGIFHDYHTVAFVCSGALVASLLVAYKLLPRDYRAVATIVCVGYPILMDHARGGVVGIIMLPFLMIAVAGWERIGRGGRLDRRAVIAALCFGVALSVQQLSWMMAPFFVTAIFLTRWPEVGAKVAFRVTALWAVIAAGTMLVINSPFIIWNPGSWISGVTEPLRQKAIAEGEGMVDIPISLHFGTGNLNLYSEGGAAVFAGLFVLFVLYFDRLRPAWIVVPAMALVFQARPLIEYFAIPALAWAVMLLTADRDQELSPRPWPLLAARRRIGIGVVAMLPAVGLWTLGLATPQPLDMKITGVVTDGALNQIDQMTVHVTNKTGSAMAPHFMITNGYSTSFWNVVSGAAKVPGHQSSDYVISTPGPASSPGTNGDFTLAAVSDVPASVSYAPKMVAAQYNTGFLDDLGRQYAAGDTAEVDVQLRDRHGRVAKAAHVQVVLNQVVFTDSGIRGSNLSVNGGTAGQPATALTDSLGVAHFTIKKGNSDPTGLVHLQAWIKQSGSIPTYGYSPFLTQQWP